MDDRAPLAKPSTKVKSTKEEAAQFLQAELVKLQARVETLSTEKKALIEEFVKASDEDAPEKVKKNIRARIPEALAILDDIMENGKSEGVRAGIAKWFVDRGLTPDILGGIDAEAARLSKLIADLKE